MARMTACPSADEWRQFLVGQTRERDAERLGEHLANCAACLAAAASVATTDALLETVRMEARAPTGLDLDVDEGLIARICMLGAPARFAVGPAELAVDESADFANLLGPAEMPDELGRIGPYGILRTLGRGGMGTVFAARQDRPRRVVALKMIHAGQRVSGHRLERFRSESETLAGLRHPHIVQVYDVGEHDGRAYFTMEYAERGSLAQRVAVAPLPGREAAELLLTLARASDFAHERGVIHRDLKPSNVLLTEDGVPKISDFGLAKHFAADAEVGADRTESGAMLGTPNYMAPEQATGRNQEVGRSADVYALGAILYECLTGRPPFQAANVLETLEQVRTQEPVPPARLQPRLPRDLQTICLKCLEKEPRRRYASAHALADDLQRYLADKPIAARPVRAWERAWKWVRRKPAAAALLAVSAISALTLAAGVLVYNTQLQEAVETAEANETRAVKQHELADARYRLARDSMRKMLDRLDAESVADTPRLLELRLALLEDAQKFFDGVLPQADGADPTIRIDVALFAAAMGSTAAVLGRAAPARANLERAVALLEALQKELPADHREYDRCIGQLAGAHWHLAGLDQAAGRWDDAGRHWGAALALNERMAAKHPDDPKLTSAQAKSEHLVGAYHQNRNQRPEAVAHYQKSIALGNALINAHPNVEAYRVEVAGTEQNLGLMYAQAGRTGEAQAAYEKTIGLLQPLLVRRPENATYQLTFAAACVNKGSLLMGLGKQDEAAKVLDLGIASTEKVLALEPRNIYARVRGVEVHGTRAQLHDGRGEWADAVKHWDRVVELNDAASTWLYRLFRAISLSRAGLHTRAAVEAQALQRDPQISPDGLSNLAGVYVLSIEPARKDATLPQPKRLTVADGYAARAVALYQLLVDRGYFQNADHAKEFVNDKDLHVLYDRPDFQKVLTQVKSAKQKSTP